MLKKANNYHLFFLIVIVFILNTMLFKTINTIKAQGDESTSGWIGPEGRPGEGIQQRILTSPMRTDLDLGGFDIIGDGNIDIDGNINIDGWFGIGTVPWTEFSIIGGVGVNPAVGGSGYAITFPTYSGQEDGSVQQRLWDEAGNVTVKINSRGHSYFNPSAGNFGIGNTNPTAKLDITGQGNMPGIQITEGGGVGSNWTTPMIRMIDGTINSYNQALDIYASDGAAAPVSQFRFVSTVIDTSTETPLMVIGANGRVGIGITSPEAKLHVYRGDSEVPAIYSDNYATAVFENNTHSMIEIWSPNDKQGGFYFSDPEQVAMSEFVYSHKNDTFRFASHPNIGSPWSTHMLIDGPTGNVGIGTSIPNRKLHIYSSSTMSSFENAEINLQSGGLADDRSHWGIYHDIDSDDLRFWHGEEDRLTITDDGAVVATGAIIDANTNFNRARSTCNAAVAYASGGNSSGLIMIPLPAQLGLDTPTNLDIICMTQINQHWHAGGVAKDGFWYQNCGSEENSFTNYTSYISEYDFENQSLTNQDNGNPIEEGSPDGRYSNCTPTNAFICCSQSFPTNDSIPD